MNRAQTKKLIRSIGGPSAVADAIGVTKQAVSLWRKVPNRRVLEVCRFCNFAVTPHQFRPDLYPNPTDALPVESGDVALSASA